MKVGFLQFDCKFGEKEENINKIEGMLSDVPNGALITLPELCITGYAFRSKKELFDLAEEVPGYSTSKLIDLCRKKKIFLIFGIPEKEGRKIFNTAVLIGPSGIIGKVRKAELFMKEKLFFDEGNFPYRVFKIGGIKIGIGICYAYMFPEVWRTLALQGADIFCNPSNLIFPFCLKAMEVRSLENGVYTILCNRVGKERGIKFFGESKIIDRLGNTVKYASDKPILSIININPKDSRNKKWNAYNNLFRDRRQNLYYKLGDLNANK